MARTKYDKQVSMIDEIIEIMPEIKGKRDQILKQLLRPKIHTTGEYVVEKINPRYDFPDNKVYYKDNKTKAIINQDLELLGIWTFDKQKGEFEYCMFNDVIKFDIYLPSILS